MKRVASIVLNNFTNDNRVLKETISLQNAGYEPTIIALCDHGLQEHEIVQGIKVHRLVLKTRQWSKHKCVQLIKYVEFIYRAVKGYRSYEIIHCNDLDALLVGVIIKRCFHAEVRVVYDAHEYECNDVPNEHPYKIKLKYYWERFLIRYADAVMTVSDSIANEYAKMYGIRKPALVLNTPVYTCIAKKNLFREIFNIRQHQAIFLYQGGLSRGRGIELLLEAFELLLSTYAHYDTAKPVLIFMGYGPLEPMIQSRVKKNIGIFFHPAVSGDVLLDYTSSADFGILCYENSCLNHEYCSPNKMFEYIMAELPVLVSNLYEMKRLVQTYGLGVVASSNTPEGFKEAMKEILTMESSLLIENIKKAKKIYHWDVQEKVLLDLYRGLQ